MLNRYFSDEIRFSSADRVGQEVQGFPTVKVFPRGGQLPPQKYEGGERTASNFIRWASRSVPNKVAVLAKASDIPAWLDKVCLNIHLLLRKRLMHKSHSSYRQTTFLVWSC